MSDLLALSPDYLSLTNGALGNAGHASLSALKSLKQFSDTPVTAHMIGADKTKSQARAFAQVALDLGVSELLVLRGDARENQASDFCYASDLLFYLQSQFGGQALVDLICAALEKQRIS